MGERKIVDHLDIFEGENNVTVSYTHLRAHET